MRPATVPDLSAYNRRRDKLIRELHQADRSQPVGLNKPTSNLFRARAEASKLRIDVHDFHHVLSADPDAGIADVEGMTSYEELVNETLKVGMLPAVVPQLKTITVGGAVSGLGIESSSFKYGLVHETVEEMEVLLADGTTLLCSPRQSPDLFYGLPNSYGTLGYILRLRVKLSPAKYYVKLVHRRFSDLDKLFSEMTFYCGNPYFDFIDGAVFGRDEGYIVTAEFTNSAPYTSDYTYRKIYYRSIRERELDYLTAQDYIWRWDTDWFWCSRVFHAQHPVVRLLAGRLFLNSKTYQRIMRWSRRLPLRPSTESVIQDVDIPIEHAPEFLKFLLSEVGILPIWVCPFQSYDARVKYPLCAIGPGTLYVNFGFWDMLPRKNEDGFYNRKIEKKAAALCGVKGLYSSSYYDEETFWSIYDRKSYDALKKKYDPNHRFRNLYEKTVLKL